MPGPAPAAVPASTSTVGITGIVPPAPSLQGTVGRGASDKDMGGAKTLGAGGLGFSLSLVSDPLCGLRQVPPPLWHRPES